METLWLIYSSSMENLSFVRRRSVGKDSFKFSYSSVLIIVLKLSECLDVPISLITSQYPYFLLLYIISCSKETGDQYEALTRRHR